MRHKWTILAALTLASPVPSAHGDPLAAAPARQAHRTTADLGSAMSSLILQAGQGRVFHTANPIANLFVADPKIAEARPASPNSVFVFGLALGRTTVAALDQAGNLLAQYDVVVRPSTFGANESASAVRQALPDSNVHMFASPEGISADGNVTNPADAERIATTARTYLGKDQRFDNRTTISSSVQVTLRVRIAEISRNITRQLGINWSALSNIGRVAVGAALTDGVTLANLPYKVGAGFGDGKNTINAVLDLLAEDQLITLLAEPNLTARSGETASFLAGGEFPIPVGSGNNTITIAFKSYGVSLSFVPTVLTDGRISIHVRPEVSELSTVGAVSLPIGTGLLGTSTITIPAITVRRADTTVELGSGQSFAIAGLLQGQNLMTKQGLPYLGEIPILGALFKSDQFQKNKSELVIIVTPYLVNPVSAPDALYTPMDDFAPAGDVDRLLLLRQRARGTGPTASGLPSPVSLAAAGNASFKPLPPGTGFILP